MRKWLALVILVIFVAEQAPLLAAGQTAAFGNGATPGANSATSATTIDLLVGRSTLLNVGATIARVSLTGTRHRRRARHLAAAAAHPRQEAGDHLAVRVGPQRRDQDL